MIMKYDVPITFDEDRTIRKWKPIIDMIAPTRDDEFKKLLSIYGEYYSWKYYKTLINVVNKTITPEEKMYREKFDPFGEENWDDDTTSKNVSNNHLPINMYTLAKLNLENKTIVITSTDEHLEDHQTSIDFNREFCWTVGVENAISHYESVAMNDISTSINKKLEEFDTFYIDCIINEMYPTGPFTAVMMGSDITKIVYKSKYGFS